MNTRLLTAALVLLTFSIAGAHETSSSDAPVVLDAADKAGLEAARGKMAFVTGKVKEAEWSKSGKVLNITFENAPSFMAAAFEKNRKKLDEAFSGDLAKAVAGATVKLSGKLQAYGGHLEELKDSTQLIITGVNQVTIVEPAAPTTQPASE
jgi:hypothetical protein